MKKGTKSHTDGHRDSMKDLAKGRFFENLATSPKLYRSYYPHRLRELVSPVCGIFLFKTCKYFAHAPLYKIKYMSKGSRTKNIYKGLRHFFVDVATPLVLR